MSGHEKEEWEKEPGRAGPAGQRRDRGVGQQAGSRTSELTVITDAKDPRNLVLVGFNPAQQSTRRRI